MPTFAGTNDSGSKSPYSINLCYFLFCRSSLSTLLVQYLTTKFLLLKREYCGKILSIVLIKFASSQTVITARQRSCGKRFVILFRAVGMGWVPVHGSSQHSTPSLSTVPHPSAQYPIPQHSTPSLSTLPHPSVQYPIPQYRPETY